MSISLSSCSIWDENPYSYSDHTYPQEEMYKTVLADPAKLKDGKPVIAITDSTPEWAKKMEFRGFTKNDTTWGYDVRFVDISEYDLSIVDDYNDLSFNSATIWPDTLPDGFDPDYILEVNKNPGLGIRDLHEQGITGKGVGIAIIDQALMTDHEQYKDNLMYYERIHYSGDGASMHGPGVASIAVGKDIGVAPDSKLYYIANSFSHYKDNNQYELDFSITADCIYRILEINSNLPDDEKIRVISISRGMSKSDNGYKELIEAIDKANSENIFVITTSTEMYYKNFILFGMDRDYLENPDDFDAYIMASWIEDSFYNRPDYYKNMILFPMGSRTYASCSGTDDYEICHNGGLSWSVPWCAGFYALCCQVKPDITPEEFIKLVKDTAIPAETVHEDKTYTFGKIVNPAEVIKALQESK